MLTLPMDRPQLKLAFAAFVVAVGISHPAYAKRNGITAPDCSGCHGGAGASVDVSASPWPFSPNDDVTFTVSIRRSDAAAQVGGLYVSPPALGELRALSGEGLELHPGYGLTHTGPKAAVNGTVTFRFGWRAPANPGGLGLVVAALAGNGDGRSGGDQPGYTQFLAAFGCTGVTHYADFDRDGYGRDELEAGIGCDGDPPPEGYATKSGDCNDNEPAVHPSATELCNKKDDDCDGEVDEDSEPVELWPDEDGDGYFSARDGMPMMGCLGIKNFAAVGGDCGPKDPTIHPGSEEVCNGFDDNCEGRVDELVRPRCGIGYCTRESFTCDASDCSPGEPRAERCNYLDDDCNGLIDDGDICADGGVCVQGKCIGASTPGASGGTTTGGAPGTSGGTGTGGSSGGMPGMGGGNAGESAVETPATVSCTFGNGRRHERWSALIALGAVLTIVLGNRRRSSRYDRRAQRVS